MEILEKILSFTSEGYISIDSKGFIREYNNKAKDIFGIVNKNTLGHQGGSLKQDDCLIIADNALGFDDGNLTELDLEILGIDDDVNFGDGFIYIGNKEKFTFKTGSKYLELEHEFQSKKIKASINPIKREIIIEIDAIEFPVQYIFSFGHMVILNAEGEIKYYQEHGYTARGESIKEILNGKHYLDKKPNKALDIMGKSIDFLHQGNIVEKFKEIAKQKRGELLKQSITINGKPLICDIFSTEEGAWMRIEDVSEYRSLMISKEKVLKELGNLQNKPHLSEKYKEIEFLGNSEEIIKVRELAYKASQSRSNVVISGESGTGKSLLANQIHKNSIFSEKPFIEVNCSAIPENLFESEFFGYEKGAFTGASTSGKEGYFEMVKGGTLFLDEIVNLPIAMQSKLLSVLQNKRFYRVGGSKEVQVDFRLIVASNQSLETAVNNNDFREDLYYRLNVFPINIPSLRERKEDISILIHHMIPKIRNNTGKPFLDISEDAIVFLSACEWIGNVRELENIVERTANMVNHEILLTEDFSTLKSSKMNALSLKTRLDECEKKALIQTLEIVDGDKKKAMDLLNLKKTAFYEKIKKYGLK